MEFPTIDKFAKEVAEKALDEITYEGKTVREWVDIIIKQQPSEDCISRDDVDAYIAKLMSGYLYDEERTRLEEFSAYLWELPSVTPRTNLAETSRDCISRQAVLEQAIDFGLDTFLIPLSLVKELPSVTPKAEPCEDCISELIREFDNKHPAVFADYMRDFNNHPISEIIEYMWDMHDLLEDIKYRLPDDGGGEDGNSN